MAQVLVRLRQHSLTSMDIDGKIPLRLAATRYIVGSVTGALSVAIGSVYTNVAAGFQLEVTALIEGRTFASVWDFGDGVTISNRPYATHAWATPGNYVIVLGL